MAVIAAKDRARGVEWAAGLFEGEGSITCGVAKAGHNYTTLHLGMTDKDVVEAFVVIVERGRIREVRPRQPHHKDKYLWQVSAARDVEHVLNLLLPFFGERRTSRAVQTLAVAKTIDKNRRRPLCPKGHSMSGDNVAYWGGGRRCRACNSAWTKAWTQRKKLEAAHG